MKRIVIASITFLAATAQAAPAAKAVETDVGETRACLPVDGGALVGTGGGLALVGADGAVERVWTASDGLPGTRIDAIGEAGDELWVGTETGAARVTLAGDKLAVVRTIAAPGVRDVARLGDATYLATWGGGVVEVTAGGAKALAIRGKGAGAKLRASALAVAGGALYAGTTSGLFRLERGALVAVPVAVAPEATIQSMYGDGDRLWIATADGLYLRDGDALVPYGGGDIRRVAGDGTAIVAASIGDGLRRADRGRLVALAGAPRAAMAQAFASRGGASCAGGLDGVWLRAGSDKPWVRGARRDGPPSNDIAALAADGERLWVGTFDRGLAVRERGAWRTIAHPDLDGRINALLPTQGRLWIATASGLFGFDGRDVTRMSRADGLPTRSVLSLAALRDGRVAAGTSHGAVVLGTRPERLGPKDLDVGNVWAIAEDADGRIWLGTTTGLYRGRAGDAAWQRFAMATGHLRDDWVTALVVRDRFVYAGTYHGGVTRLDAATGDATQLTDGWINPAGLAFDGERLLAATMDGLVVDNARVRGLPGNDVTAIARAGGALFVATRRGLAQLQ